ncbi:SDR family oxidoreductase [Leptospira sp. 96542]|nr:SDR family oxidoreductase [Leptospira sp. 96542]
MKPLSGQTILITGITDKSSLALTIAKECQKQGATLVCSGLGLTESHKNLSENSIIYLQKTYADFQEAVKDELGDNILTLPLDVSLQSNIDQFVENLKNKGIRLNAFLHSIAMDKTIRKGKVKPIMEVNREEFMDTMNVTAFSFLVLTQSLYNASLFSKNASLLALSYLGAEKLVSHPYKNVGVAKAALERIAKELALELGKSDGIQVNVLRFSPFTGSKAGSAIEGLTEAVAVCNELSPLGNARPQDLAEEVAYLFRPSNRVTGEIRHIDGGYHIRG